MRARVIFAALAAMFARPSFHRGAELAPPARLMETEGFVSEASAFRIRAAFSRFARFVGGGG